MRLNPNQLKRIAQHLNTLWIEEKYRRIYLDCLDPAAKKRPGETGRLPEGSPQRKPTGIKV